MSADTPFTFHQWLDHWGEDRLLALQEDSKHCYQRMWDMSQDSDHIRAFPAWELLLGCFWQEDIDSWHKRWTDCGGVLNNGRMLASKWHPVWRKLSSTFSDGYGNPYPPYARSSCAFWQELDVDESIVYGALSEVEYDAFRRQHPTPPLIGHDGLPIPRDLLKRLHDELEQANYLSGGLRRGASRAERVAHKEKLLKDELARAQRAHAAAYEEQELQRDEKDRSFRLMDEIDGLLQQPPERRSKPSEWIASSLDALRTTPHFDGYPNWHARAWLASANIHSEAGELDDELRCLERALELNQRLPVKRRIKKLQAARK